VTNIKLVLVDNKDIFRKGLAKILENEPDIEVVCTCRTGIEAIVSVYKHQPDVILIDAELPECNSFEVMRYIHEELPETNIIVLTQSGAGNGLISAFRVGAKAYLSKDISIENLTKTITLVAEGGVVISTPMASRLLAEFNFLDEGKDMMRLITLLTKREKVVLPLVARGLTNREIATTLVISENTVKVHLRNIMGKLHAHTRQRAVSLVKGKGLLPSVTQTDTK